MNSKELKEKISEISNSEFPLIDFFNDIDWLEDKRFNTEKAYKDIEKIYNVFVHYIDKSKQLEMENQELKKTLNKTRKMGLETIEEKEQLSNELHKLNCYRNIELNEITKLKKAFDILKEKVELPLENDFDVVNKDDIHLYRLRTKALVNEEEYELLKEVL